MPAEFCSYPGWAANAFSGPDSRVPQAVLDYQADGSGFGYIAPGYASSYGYVAPRRTEWRYAAVICGNGLSGDRPHLNHRSTFSRR